MREIAMGASVLGMTATIVFHEGSVEATLQFHPEKVTDAPACAKIESPSTVVLNQRKEQGLGANAVPAAAAVPALPAATELPPLLLFVVDDDAAPRAAGKGIIRKLNASTESKILGASYEEVQQVPELVLQADADANGALVVCLFDENMHWKQGTILGSSLTSQLRAAGFMGVILARTANDAESSVERYIAAGADGLLSKGLKAAAAVEEIRRVCMERPYLKAAQQ